jgi:hypothetical protein
MAYSRGCLGQDDDWEWTPEVWEQVRLPESSIIPGGEQIWSTTSESKPWLNPTPQESYPYTTLPSKDAGWWSGIKDILIPVSTAAAGIIKAVTGQSVQPGTRYDTKTGRYITPSGGIVSAQSWLIPALLVGGGVLLVSKMKRK